MIYKNDAKTNEVKDFPLKSNRLTTALPVKRFDYNEMQQR